MPQDAFEIAAELLEKERRRIANELEQGVIEALNLLLAQAVMYEQSLAANPQAKIAVSVMGALGKQALQQTRELLDNLHPTILTDLGLEAALESWLSQLSRLHGLAANFTTLGKYKRLPLDVELNTFRAVQESVNLLVREGKAFSLEIKLEQKEKVLQIQIQHDSVNQPSLLFLSPKIKIEQVSQLVKLTVSFENQAELTERELEVLSFLAAGMTNKEIAQKIQVSPRTVNFHLNNIYVKLEVNSRTEALIEAFRQGLLQRPV